MLVYCIQTAEEVVKLLSRPGSPIILVFGAPAPVPSYPLCEGAKYTGVGNFLRFSTEISVNLGNGTR